MDYVSGPVILYSQDKIRMLDLLSDVFEFEIDTEEDVVQSGSLHLKLIELPDSEKENFECKGVKFAFKLKGPEEIKKIINKYNFFLYRKSDSTKIEKLQTNDDQELSIVDIDGRVWQFDVDSNLENWQ